MSCPNEYFEYRVPSKFLGEIQIVLSTIIFVTGLVCIVSFSTGLDSKQGHEKDIDLAYITYSSLTLGVAVIDIISGALLISATNKISLQRCFLWRGSAIATLILFGLLTLAFMIVMGNPVIVFAFVPTVVFKPFAIWVVQGFMNELLELQSFPSTDLPPAKPSL